MKRILYRSLAIFALAASCEAGCNAQSADSDDASSAGTPAVPQFKFYCPAADEAATWSSYGSYALSAVGSDQTGDELVSVCGWTYYKNHVGGYGGTLEVSAFGDKGTGVVFTWAYNELSAIYLQTGWLGTTDKGVGIGAALDAVLAAHPDLYRVSDTVYMSSDASKSVTATFGPDLALVSLEIGDYFRE